MGDGGAPLERAAAPGVGSRRSRLGTPRPARSGHPTAGRRGHRTHRRRPLPAIGSTTRCCGSSAETRVMPCTHRAAVCTALEGPDCVTTRDVPDAQAGPGTVRVAVRAAGVNYPDYLLTRGEYQLKLEPPFTPGMEVAGIVAECGPPTEGSTPWPIGTPVIAWTPGGGFAEQVVVSSDAVFPLPEPFSYVEGAAFTVAARTAYHALVERGGLQTGERLLGLGATRGLGLAAGQLAKLLRGQDRYA